MSILDLLGFKKKDAVGDESQFNVENKDGEKIFKYGDITYSKLKKHPHDLAQTIPGLDRKCDSRATPYLGGG